MEPIEPLAPDARELLAAYRRDRPGPHGRARNWPAVRARLEPRPRGEGRHPFTLAWWFGGMALALAAAVLLLVHALFVAWQATHVGRAPVPEANDVVVSTSTPETAATATPTVVPAPLPSTTTRPPEPPAPTPVPVQRPRVAAPTNAPPAPAETSSAELALVGAARTALTDRDWSTTLASLDEHARRFPGGVLAEERAALRAIALCRSGAADARTAVLAFNSRYPGSHHHRSIKAACAERTDPGSP